MPKSEDGVTIIWFIIATVRWPLECKGRIYIVYEKKNITSFVFPSKISKLPGVLFIMKLYALGQ